MHQNETQIPQPDMSHLLRSFEQVMDQNRLLMEEMAQVARTESLRFAGRRLQRANQALENLQDAQGVSKMLGSQQQWLHGLMEDYAEQSARYVQVMGELSTNALNAARDAALRPMAMAEDAARDAAGQVSAAAEQVHAEAQDAAEAAQPIH